MATSTLNARVKHKRDTSANWTANNPVLLNGEIILVDTAEGELRFKVGDGTKTYTQLPFTDEIVRGMIPDSTSDLTNDSGFITSANIPVTKVNNKTGAVNLTYADVGAAASSHRHTTQYIDRPTGLRGLNDVTLQPLVSTTRANRLAFLPASQVIIEKTTDGGTTWEDAGVADVTKAGLFSEVRPGVQIPLLNGVRSVLCGLRITITAMKYDVPENTPETQKYDYWDATHAITAERYCQLKELYFWLSSSNDSIGVTVQRAKGVSPNVWENVFSDSSYYMTGWSGCDYIKLTNQGTFGGNKTQTSNYWNYRITLMTLGKNGSSTEMNTGFETQQQVVSEIRGYGDSVWSAPNNYMAEDKIYKHDYNQNVTFPAQVTATGGFSGALAGNATSATEFKDSKSVALTGDVTGSASSKAGWSVATTLANSGVTAGSYGPAANASPAAGSTFDVPYITVDAKGRTTGASTKKITMPTPPVTSVNSKTGDVSLTYSDVGAAASSHGVHVTYDTTNNPKMDGTASKGTATTVARSDHIHPTDTSRASASDLASHTGNTSNPHSVTAAQVGAVPTSRQVNGHALSADVTLTYSDVGAAASSHGTHVTFDSTNNPKMDGTAAKGTATTVARSDHVHPTDTSRASASDLSSHTGNTTVHITANERTAWNAKANTSDIPAKTSDLTNDSGFITAEDIPESAPTNHASTATTYGSGTENNYGHVKLSDSTSGTNTAASGGTAATPKAVSDALSAAKTYADGISDNNFTDTLKSKLDDIEDGAQVNTVTSVNSKTGAVNLTYSDVGAAASSHGTHVTYSTTSPVMDGTAAVGTASTVARSDHVHPTDTSRAPTSHAVNASTYGLGTTSVYGHVKTVNNVTTAAHASGLALSAYQGTVLKGLIDDQAARFAYKEAVSLNTIKTSGLYFCYNCTDTPSHQPWSSFSLEVIAVNDVVRQILRPNVADGFCWERRNDGSSWDSWAETGRTIPLTGNLSTATSIRKPGSPTYGSVLITGTFGGIGGVAIAVTISNGTVGTIRNLMTGATWSNTNLTINYGVSNDVGYLTFKTASSSSSNICIIGG